MCAENICAEQKSHQSQRWTHSLGDCWWLPKNKYDVRLKVKWVDTLPNILIVWRIFKRETASETK